MDPLRYDGASSVCDWDDLPAAATAALLGQPGLRSVSLADLGLSQLPHQLPDTLESVDLRGNAFSVVPEAVLRLPHLRELNLAGNKIRRLSLPTEHPPPPIESLQLGGNGINEVDASLAIIAPTLRVLYLGGNCLKHVPTVIPQLEQLEVLYLNSNQLVDLPVEMVRLTRLVALHLQYNQLAALPAEILALKHLRSFSVRGNPLLTHFADEFTPDAVPALKELAARAVHGLPESHPSWQRPIPHELEAYMATAHVCLGCRKASFVDARFSHVEFLDVCGSFHVPFLQYLCSGRCQYVGQLATAAAASTAVDPTIRLARLRKILLDTYDPTNTSSVEDVHRELVQTIADGFDY